MSLARRFAAAGAAATLATLALAAPAASAAPIDQAGHTYWYYDGDDGSLVNVSENNVGPFQGCNDNVPVNVLGIQGAVSDIAAVVGLDNDGNPSSTTKVCDQQSYQDN